MKKKVIHMVTVSESIMLMRGQLNFLREQGYDVIVISSSGNNFNNLLKEEGVRGKRISMSRGVSPIKDLISLFKIIVFFLQEKPDIVNSGTPKAGLLGMLAAWLTRVPYRVFTARGLVFDRYSGFKKSLLKLTEKITCYCADNIICISPSIEKKLIKHKIADSKKTIVFGKGSSNGINLVNFEFTNQIEQEVDNIVNKYALKNNFIIGNVGRLNVFKGITELVISFEELQKKYKNIKLLVIGELEDKDSLSTDIKEKILHNSDIIYVGYQKNPIPYYYVMDILAFPTYTEGFGNVSIEAQATGTPVITTENSGAEDTLINGETGILVKKKDTNTLSNAIEKFILDRDLITIMGTNGKKWVYNNFSNIDIWNNLNDLYLNNT